VLTPVHLDFRRNPEFFVAEKDILTLPQLQKIIESDFPLLCTLAPMSDGRKMAHASFGIPVGSVTVVHHTLLLFSCTSKPPGNWHHNLKSCFKSKSFFFKYETHFQINFQSFVHSQKKNFAKLLFGSNWNLPFPKKKSFDRIKSDTLINKIFFAVLCACELFFFGE
jgi:hypothetical protein